MFELADYLTGIYKVEDCTNSNTIQNFSYSISKPNSIPSSTQQTNNTFDELRSAITQLTGTVTSTQPDEVENDTAAADTSNVSIIDKSVTNEHDQESIVYETSIDEHITLPDSCVEDSIAEPMQIDDNQIETVVNPSPNESEDMFD